MADDLDPLEQHLLGALAALEPSDSGAPARPEAAAIWRAQIESRNCDLAARWLQKEGRSFYTIGSAGHESNAAVALALRPTDPALLHYRSGAFYLARAAQVGRDGVPDILQGVTAATDEPIAGGRHKVFGHHELAVIPQTSTIASHLPRAVGIAIAIDRARKLGVSCTWPADAIVVCSFGDASLNHATAQAALNTAAHAAHQHLPVPVLFVCEDNGLGISVPSPAGWVAGALASRPDLRYETTDGDDPAGTLEDGAGARGLGAREPAPRRAAPAHRAVPRACRSGRRDGLPLGAGRASRSRPRPAARRRCLARRLGRPNRDAAGGRVPRVSRTRARGGARRGTPPATRDRRRRDAPLASHSPNAVADLARSSEHLGEPLTLALAINAALADVLDRHPETLLFGEDVAAKGGVYGVTRGLHTRFGAGRVFDTLLDETSILGLALGAAVSGFVPLPEIQYLAYLHNAEDQLRGEAATLQFFSQGQYRNGMVVRIAGYGYQKGFGGHFHNDDSVAVLRDIPGIVIASPSRPDDAAAMLKTCVAAAKVDGSVCAFLEPIALYHTRDLYEEDDGGWLAVPRAGHVPLGSARTYGDGRDLTMLTWGNGLLMSLRVARRLEARGIGTRVVDLRWLAPLPIEDIAREAIATQRVLVVDETRRTGGVSEGVIATLIDVGFDGQLARVTSKDSFVPLGDAANLVLLSEDEIEAAALALV